MARIDYDRVAAAYHQGRAKTPDALDGWRLALAPYLGRGLDAPVLDLGSGTGIWSSALTRWFGVTVIGVEPAEGMRAVARGNQPPQVHLVGGTAEAIPLRDGSCAAAWLSTVIHHFEDLDGAAGELRRVLRSSAPILIRSGFPGRLEEVLLYRFFPAARRVAETFPTVSEVVRALGAVGLEMESLQRVRQPTPPSLHAFGERVQMMRHADSALAPLTDQEFAEGMERIQAAVAAGMRAQASGIDLLVLQPRALRGRR